MNTNRILFGLFAMSLIAGTVHAQQRSAIPPAATQGERAAAAGAAQTEAQVKEQLQQAAQQALRAQQMQGQERMNTLRELERLFVKLQQAAQRGEAASLSAEQVRLREAAQALEDAAQGGRRLSIRPNGLGGGLNVQVGGGAWWTDAALTARLGLSEDQKARIDRAFVNHRVTLEASRDNLVKEEAQLTRLLDAEPLDRNAVTGQIFRVSNARGEMERANAAMTLEMREQMTRAQWNQLQALSPRATVTVEVPVTGGGGRGARQE